MILTKRFLYDRGLISKWRGLGVRLVVMCLGKTDSIEKVLNEKILMLKARKPAVLLLDNLDFLNVHLDDEERKKFVDKIYRSIVFFHKFDMFRNHSTSLVSKRHCHNRFCHHFAPFTRVYDLLGWLSNLAQDRRDPCPRSSKSLSEWVSSNKSIGWYR